MRRRPTPFFTLLCVMPLLVLCWMPIAITGCASREEVSAQRASVVAERDKLDAAAVQAQQMLDRLGTAFAALQTQANALQATANNQQASSDLRAQALAAFAAVTAQLTDLQKRSADATSAVESARAKSSELGARVTAADAALAKADAPSNSGTGLAALLAAFFPGPGAAVPLVTVGLGLGYKLLQLSKAKSALEGKVDEKSTALANIVTSIDALATIAPEVAAAIDKHGPLLDAIQKGVGKQAVDEVQSAKVAAAA